MKLKHKRTHIPSLAFALPIKYPLSPSTIVAKNTSFNPVAFMLTVTALYVRVYMVVIERMCVFLFQYLRVGVFVRSSKSRGLCKSYLLQFFRANFWCLRRLCCCCCCSCCSANVTTEPNSSLISYFLTIETETGPRFFIILLTFPSFSPVFRLLLFYYCFWFVSVWVCCYCCCGVGSKMLL